MCKDWSSFEFVKNIQKIYGLNESEMRMEEIIAKNCGKTKKNNQSS